MYMKNNEKKILKIIIKQNILKEYRNKKYIIEEKENEEIKTVGQLKGLLQYIKVGQVKEKLSKEAKKQLKDLAIDTILSFVPGGGAIKSGFGFLKAVTGVKDNQADKIRWLKTIDIDDRVSDLVDDKIEEEFLKLLADKIDNIDDDMEIGKLNMTALLNNFIEKENDSTKGIGLSGYES